MLKNDGFSMIEVLVTILVAAIGLLGVASLQVGAVKNTREAQVRSLATVLAHDMSERMRSNLVGLATPNQYYDNMVGAPGAMDCITGTCTPDQLAIYDYSQWRTQIQNLLPLGVGTVCIDDTPDDGVDGNPACNTAGGPSQFAIKIWWDEDGDGVREVRFVTKVIP